MLSKFHYFFFIVLSTLLLSGVNEYLSMVFGQAEFMSFVILSLVFLLLLLNVANQGKINILNTEVIDKSYVIAMVAYILIGAIMAWSYGNRSSVYWGIRYYSPSLFVFLVIIQSITRLNQELGYERIIRLFRNIIMVNAILALLDYFSQGSLGLFHHDERYSGLISNANDAGFLFNILLILNYHIFKINNSLLGLIGVLISTTAIFITFSKTAIICAIVIIIWILTFELRKGKILNRYLIVVFLALLLFKGPSLDSQFQGLDDYQLERLSHIMEFLNGNYDDEITTNRTNIMDVAVNKIQGNWIFGQGFRSFSFIETMNVGVHNIYILILGESGIIPLVLYIYFLAKLAMLTSRRYWKLNAFKTVSLISFALFMYGFTNHNIFFSKFIIIVIALGVTLQTEIRREYFHLSKIRK